MFKPRIDNFSLRCEPVSLLVTGKVNKAGTSKVGAESKAQKAQSFKNVKRGILWAF